MLSQISNIDNKQYALWVNMPVDRPLRLFASEWMEMLTKTPWWLVPLFWVPILTYLLYNGNKEADALKLRVSLMFKIVEIEKDFYY